MATTAIASSAEDPRKEGGRTASKQPGVVKIEIPALVTHEIVFPIRGKTPLLCHNWSQEAQEIMAGNAGSKPRSKRPPKDPLEEFAGSLYWMTPRPARLTADNFDAVVRSAVFGFPVVSLKRAAVDAAMCVSGLNKTDVRRAFHIVAQQDNLVAIQGIPEVDRRPVRIQGTGADMRYRGIFTEWAIVITVRYSDNLLTPAQIAHLFNHAGFSVGIGNYRPEKGGQYGMFEVAA